MMEKTHGSTAEPARSDAAIGLAEDLQDRYAAFALAFPDLTALLTGRIDQLAQRLALELSQGGEHERAEAALAVVSLLDPGFDWWTTPQGKLTASAARAGEGETVTYAQAARMLGIARGAVSTLVQRGRLDAVRGGGVLVDSIYRRIAELNAQRAHGRRGEGWR